MSVVRDEEAPLAHAELVANEDDALIRDLSQGLGQPARLLMRGGHVLEGIVSSASSEGLLLDLLPGQASPLPDRAADRPQSWTVRISDVVAALTVEE